MRRNPLVSSLLFISCLVTSIIGSAALAQDRTALVGGRLIDGYGGPPLANSVILIEDGRIVEVGSVATLAVPDGYQMVSTEGMDVLPGLWESHAHLMIVGHADYVHWQTNYSDRYGSEIMPAAALQLLLAGVTSARDLGAPLAVSIEIRDSIAAGKIPGPRLFVSGPFLQHEVEDWQKGYRWAVSGARDARDKVFELADAGVDMIKLVDQDKMTLEEAQAIVDAAHARGLKVVAHSHRPDEVRRGLEIGVDNFEHTGLTTAPEYPEDVMNRLRERTATGRVAGGPLFWTPTVEGLYSYTALVENPEMLDDPCWQRGLAPDTIADIRQSIRHPGKLGYMQLHPLRAPTLKRKIEQLKEAGVVFLVGTDSGVPMNFHCDSTWREMDGLVDIFGLAPMEVIRAATYWPAVMMGVADEVGTVEAGKKADIIAVRGDVLKHINLLQNVDLVMKAGTVYKRHGQPVEASL
ncbi:MAG: amidohydrolase family protein [Wenzhouxiangellaceae bacterium]|nr:amidohydrolase family protein [Wenzhouxiangellaceae bacterium]